MQQTCTQCGAVAQTPSKFCRQCGAALAETNEAATRQYGRQSPPPNAAPTSHPFTSPPAAVPPSVTDAVAADTARMHNNQAYAPPPPAQQAYGQPQGQPFGQPAMPTMMPPAYPMQAAPKSNWWKWALGFVLATVLVCGGLLAYTVQRTVQRASEVGYEVKTSIDDAIAKAKKDAEEAARAGNTPGNLPEGVPPPPPLPPAPGESIKNLDQLRYPNAKVTSTVKAMGQHVVTLETTATYEQVKEYYQKYLGEPIVETDEENTKELVFQKAPFMVTIDQPKNGTKELTITLISSGLIPSMNK